MAVAAEALNIQLEKNIPLQKTPLYNLHKSYAAKIVPFAGYELPIQFSGLIDEHNFVRSGKGAGLFDVSHMGQILLSGEGLDEALSKLVGADITKIREGCLKYTILTNEKGGIVDDLIIGRHENYLHLVVNGARKFFDLDHLKKYLPQNISIQYLENQALIALQGEKSEDILQEYGIHVENMGYMTTKKIKLGDVELVVSRCGYTGEDGFEISIPNDYAEGIASLLLKDERVKPIGLGARDTLRLEAGLCLYGHDINEDITAVEADLIWTIAAAKRKNGGFLGDKIICPQIASTVVRYIRSGLVGEGRQPVREGAKLYNLEDEEIGFVTSGTFSPSLQLPISMGYVHPDYADMGDIVYADVRGKKIPLAVTELPFIPHTTRSAG